MEGIEAYHPHGVGTIKTGTTTIGLTCKDGVVLGADMRATMGHLISHKETQKLFKIDDHMALTIAGLVGDAQVLARWLTAEVELYKVKRGTEMSLKAASTLMSNIMNQRKFAPFYVQLVIGGVDLEGNHIYSLDAAGGSIPDKYVTTGSGSVYVYGVLEDRYQEDMSISDGLDLCIRGLNAAMNRDAASGNGMSICSITKKEGFKRLEQEDVDKRRKKMGLPVPPA